MSFRRNLVFFLLLPVAIQGSLGSTPRPWAIVSRPQPFQSTTSTKTSFVDTLSEETKIKINQSLLAQTPRGGQDADSFVRAVGAVTQFFIACGRTVLPPTIAVVRSVVGFYKSLPMDAVLAQVGLVYCFAGGYYPTLFSSLQAAQQCGWQVMVYAIQDLVDEAIKVIDATSEFAGNMYPARELLLRQTNVVLKTVDPMKINEAAAALYTTWLGVSAVLEKEYARVISLSMTMAGYLQRVAHWVLEPPIKLCIPQAYHKWVPVTIGWISKGLAMNIAWRIQRILTASTSAMTGGLLFARSIFRLLRGRGIRLFGLIREDHRESPFDEIIGFMVGAIGFYTQISVQYKNNFSFEVPWPFYLVTWPFDWLEKWIQWQITK